MKELILSEEINSIKYLLAYRRGLVISEQEKTPEDTTKVVGTPTPSTGTPTTGAQTTGTQTTGAPVATTQATPVTPIKIGVKYPSITELQNLLKTKFQAVLTPDGKYGPKTAASVLAALQKLVSNNNEKPTDTPKGEQPIDTIKKTVEPNVNTQNNSQNKTTPDVVASNNFSEVDDISNI
jgi:hypothetical protein